MKRKEMLNRVMKREYLKHYSSKSNSLRIFKLYSDL